MSPSPPPPPQPIEPPVHAAWLPAGGYPYDGLFREPSMLVLAGPLATDRQREDLPNPLVSITPLHPTLPPPLDERPADSPSSSRRSSASDGSIPRTPPRSNSPPPRAFDDPLFRTLPPPPGVNVRPFPLPSIHRHAHETTDDGTTWSTEYDTDATFGGPSPKFTNSSDFVPWDVTRDWSARDVGAFVRCDLMMQGRGARRHIRVWQKKPDDEGYHSGGTA